MEAAHAIGAAVFAAGYFTTGSLLARKYEWHPLIIVATSAACGAFFGLAAVYVLT